MSLGLNLIPTHEGANHPTCLKKHVGAFMSLGLNLIPTHEVVNHPTCLQKTCRSLHEFGFGPYPDP
jgi:hypothetical protein